MENLKYVRLYYIGKLAREIANASANNAKGYRLVSELSDELRTDFAKNAIDDLLNQMQGGAQQGPHNMDREILKSLPNRVQHAFDNAAGCSEVDVVSDKKTLGKIVEAVDKHLCY